MDENKCFLIRRGELEERWDPNYQSLFEKFKKKVSNANYPVIRFHKVINHIQYGSSSLAATEKIGYPMIRMINLQNDDWDFSDLKYIQLNERDFKSWKLNKNDLLFNRTNSKELVGKCNVFKEDGAWVFASYLIRVVLDDKQMLPEYASFFLGSTLGRLQIDAISRQIAGMTNINAEEIKTLFIPLPPKEIQLIIKTLFANALKQKKQKEQQAKDLLNSIDNYLLQELGIQLPTPPSNTIANRMFTSSWQKLTGSRFDPFYNNSYFHDVNHAVKRGNLKSVHLQNIMKTNLIKGYLPNSEEKNGNNKVVQINSINEDGTFNLSNVITAKNVFAKQQQLQKGDILIVITGATIGKIGFWNEEGEYYLGGDIVKFQVGMNINPYFVFSYLRSQPAQIELKRNITGATNGHLSPHDINNLLMPVPASQSEYNLIDAISNEVMKRRERAYRLKQEAQHQFNQTKQEIEQMILE